MSNDDIKEIVKKYIEFLEHMNSNSLSEEEKKAALDVREMCSSDEEFSNMISQINSSFSTDTRNTILLNYLSKKELENAKSNEEIISKSFGISVKDIEHRELNTGKDVFIFYDDKIGRKRILENPKDKESLTEFLKEEVNDNEDFQFEEPKDSTKAILNDKLKQTALELQMVYVGDIDNYQKIIDGLDEDKRKSLDEVMKYKDKLHIKYVNIENAIALTEDGNIIEGTYNKEKNTVNVQAPKEYSYKEENISTDNSDNELSNTSNNSALENEENDSLEFNDFEDIPDILDAEGIVDAKQREEVMNNIKDFYKNPEKMDKLSGYEKDLYDRIMRTFYEKLEVRKQNKKTQVKTLKYEDNYGFSSIILISLIILVIAIIIIILIEK